VEPTSPAPTWVARGQREKEEQSFTCRLVVLNTNTMRIMFTLSTPGCSYVHKGFHCKIRCRDNNQTRTNFKSMLRFQTCYQTTKLKIKIIECEYMKSAISKFNPHSSMLAFLFLHVYSEKLDGIGSIHSTRLEEKKKRTTKQL